MFEIFILYIKKMQHDKCDNLYLANDNFLLKGGKCNVTPTWTVTTVTPHPLA